MLHDVWYTPIDSHRPIDLQATPSLRTEITLCTSRGRDRRSLPLAVKFGRDENGLHWTSAEDHVRLYPTPVRDVKDAAGRRLMSLLPDRVL